MDDFWPRSFTYTLEEQWAEYCSDHHFSILISQCNIQCAAHFFFSLSFFSVMEPLLLGRRMGSPLLRHHHIDLPTFIFSSLFSFYRLCASFFILVPPAGASLATLLMLRTSVHAPRERFLGLYIFSTLFLSLLLRCMVYALYIFFFISFQPRDRRNIGSIVAIIVRPTITYHQRTNQEPFLFDFHGKY